MRLSVIIITRNEQANITECLQTLAFADELIVVDYDSMDQTAELARRMGARVHVTRDWPGFGKQKNRALALAQGDWVLSIDADERVSPELAKEIKSAIRQNSNVCYDIPRLTQFGGQWIRHCGWTPDRVVRLFRKNDTLFSDDLVHERVLIGETPLKHMSGYLLHYSYPTLSHYWRKLEQYSQAWAQQRYARGQKTSMLRAAAAGFVAFQKSYVFKLGFLDGSMGFAVCCMQAQAAFGKYLALYWLHKNNPSCTHVSKN